MMRVVLDCNGVDPLVELPGAFDLVTRAVREGDLELLGTHILRQELANITDAARREHLSKILGLTERVPTGAFIFDVSLFDEACLGNYVDEIEVLRSGNRDNPNHTNDALIASTCLSEGAPLVTNEKRLTKRARELGIEVLRSEDLLARLGYQAPVPS